MSDLFFCPERWDQDPNITTNIANFIQIPCYSGKTVDAWQLGDWGNNWTAITSKIHIEPGWLEPGCKYRFCFWLNGGENSRGDETCRLEIFGDDWENRLVFRLNRDYTKPVLEKNHWLLYAIPFTAPAAASVLTFRFVAAGAVCTITGIPEMDMSACESLSPDERDTGLPQRHNVIFPNGWDEEEGKVVLKARGKEVSLSVKALKIAGAAAGVALSAFLIARGCRKIRKRKGK